MFESILTWPNAAPANAQIVNPINMDLILNVSFFLFAAEMLLYLSIVEYRLNAAELIQMRKK